jgi:cytochrome c biogenesis factor
VTLIALFFLVFVVGPLIFRALTKRPPSKSGTWFLAVFTFVCAACALAIRYGLTKSWGDDMLMAGVSLLLIWLGWIGVLAFGTQALRRAHPGPSTRRWTAVLGGIGTTIPWVGLARASLVAA